MNKDEVKENDTTEQRENVSFFKKYKIGLIAGVCILVLIILFILSRFTDSTEEPEIQEGNLIEDVIEPTKPEEDESSEEITYGGKELLEEYEDKGISVIPIEVSVLTDYYNEYQDKTVRTVIECNIENNSSSLQMNLNDETLTFNFDDNEELSDINTGDIVDIVGVVQPNTSAVSLAECHIVSVGNEALVFQGELETQADAEREQIQKQIKDNTEKAEQTRKEWQQYCDEHSDEIVVATPEEIWENYPNYEGKMVYTAFIGGTFTDGDITVATSNRDSWIMWSIDCHFENPDELKYIDTDEPIAVIGTAVWVSGLNYMDLNDCHIVDVGDDVRKSLDALGGQSVSEHFNYKLFKEQELGEE